MSCNVCIASVEDVDNEFASETTRRARKPHRCCECDQTIQPGAAYRYFVGKSNGRMFTTKTCALCAEIRDVFTCGQDYMFTTLWESMREEAFPDLTTASECFRDLSPETKAGVLDRWVPWKRLA